MTLLDYLQNSNEKRYTVFVNPSGNSVNERGIVDFQYGYFHVNRNEQGKIEPSEDIEQFKAATFLKAVAMVNVTNVFAVM